MEVSVNFSIRKIILIFCIIWLSPLTGRIKLSKVINNSSIEVSVLEEEYYPQSELPLNYENKQVTIFWDNPFLKGEVLGSYKSGNNSVVQIGRTLSYTTVQPGRTVALNIPLSWATRTGTYAYQWGFKKAVRLGEPSFRRIKIIVGEKVYHLYEDRTMVTLVELSPSKDLSPVIPALVKRADGILETRYTPHRVPITLAPGEELVTIFSSQAGGVTKIGLIVNPDTTIAFKKIA